MRCPDCGCPEQLPDPHQEAADLALARAMTECCPDPARAFMAAQWLAAGFPATARPRARRRVQIIGGEYHQHPAAGE